MVLCVADHPSCRSCTDGLLLLLEPQVVIVKATTAAAATPFLTVYSNKLDNIDPNGPVLFTSTLVLRVPFVMDHYAVIKNPKGPAEWCVNPALQTVVSLHTCACETSCLRVHDAFQQLLNNRSCCMTLKGVGVLNASAN